MPAPFATGNFVAEASVKNEEFLFHNKCSRYESVKRVTRTKIISTSSMDD